MLGNSGGVSDSSTGGGAGLITCWCNIIAFGASCLGGGDASLGSLCFGGLLATITQSPFESSLPAPNR